MVTLCMKLRRDRSPQLWHSLLSAAFFNYLGAKMGLTGRHMATQPAIVTLSRTKLSSVPGF